MAEACPYWSSRRGPLLARAPLRTGRASWSRIRLKHDEAPSSWSRHPVIAHRR